ncbi:MAG: FAD-binding oxidoreductase [Gammaproteobacteria bacterium]|nr:FAD-binding oxidoreductase [Gammaproteobacteria bacterium]
MLMQATAQAQEHCASYYAATANEKTNYPVLRGEQSADICVVGAGFTGIATALTLAERGYSVAVVEANRVGWGASGRNGGQMIGGISGEQKIQQRYGEAATNTLWDMHWRGNDIIRERVDKYGIDCDLKSGYIEVAVKRRHMVDLREQYHEYRARELPDEYRLLSREETRATVGTDAYVGGMINMRNGHLHPLNLCIGEARAAAALGVEIFEQSPVKDIRHGDKPRVLTAAGEVAADAVVIAGNAYHALERRHLSGLIFPAGSYIIATEPLSPEVAQSINPLNLAVSDLNNVLDYYRLSADGRLLFGGRCNYSGREPRSIKATILPRMLKIYPQLKDVRIDYEWGGKIGIVITRIPLLGRIHGNVYYCQGYSGHGVSASHVAGEIMADAVTGTLERFDLFANVHQWRIPLGQWFGNQIVAMGMLYYRLKDIL